MKKNILHLFRLIKSEPENLKKIIIILVIMVIGILGATTYFSNSNESSDLLNIQKASDDEKEGDFSDIEADNSSGNEDDFSGADNIMQSIMYIDVAGAVVNPGVITLKPESRVFEAIEAAGGLTTDASTQSINRAAILNDGDRIYIPTEKEVGNPENIPNGINGNLNVNAPVSTSNSNSGKININTADSVMLQELNGVGPSTAQKIIDYRNSNGKFKRIDDLKNVSGIGEKTFEKLKNYISI